MASGAPVRSRQDGFESKVGLSHSSSAGRGPRRVQLHQHTALTVGQVVANLRRDEAYINLASCAADWTHTKPASTSQRQAPGLTAWFAKSLCRRRTFRVGHIAARADRQMAGLRYLSPNGIGGVKTNNIASTLPCHLHRQQPLHQRMQNFLVSADRKEVFFHPFTRPQTLDVVARRELVVDQLGCRENAHACRAEGGHQGAAFKPAHRPVGLMFKRSNHRSMRARTAECAVGNSTGTSANEWGNFFLACASNSCGAYQAEAELPSAWL